MECVTQRLEQKDEDRYIESDSTQETIFHYPIELLYKTQLYTFVVRLSMP